MLCRTDRTMEYPSVVRLAFVVCFGFLFGCGSHSPSHGALTLPPALKVPPQQASEPVAASSAPAAAADCALFPGQARTGETITSVGLTDRVEPIHAPHPTNDSERLLFRQLYETLVRVDCEGHAVPGLAIAWRFDGTAKKWMVTLRENARFSDNKPVTAMDVATSWTGTGSELRPDVRRLVQSITVVDDQTLEIELQSSRPDAVLALAHTDLAITGTVPGIPWPLGTRSATVDSTTASVITLRHLPENTITRFFIAPGRDGRDLLDRGVDLLLTRDPRTLNYAATLTQFQTAPLPWQQTHVLLTPRPQAAFAFSADERRALAQDAVRGEARGAEGPFWWESLSECEVDPPQAPLATPPTPQATSRIVYNADDSAAQELAERLVGIGKYPRASGLAGTALAQALRRGNESAYILSLERRPLDPCREIQVLMDNAGWIDPHSIVPLVDTRRQAIVRRGRQRLTTEWDGIVPLDLRN